MKHLLLYNTKLIGLLLASASMAYAGTRYLFDDFDDFFDVPMHHIKEIEESFAHMREHMKEMRQSMFGFVPTKEERETLNAAYDRLSKIKPKIDKDENNIYIRFNIEDVNKNDIKITKETQGFLGTIPTKDGIVEFSISPFQLQVSRSAQFKKEQSTTQQDTGTTQEGKADNKKTEKKPSTYFYSSSHIEVQSLPYAVDLSTAQAETKDNTFTITIAKKKEALLPIAHR